MEKLSEINNDKKLPSILIIEPFYGGSHKQLIDTLMKCLPPSTLITMKAKKWHWRARCAALCLSNLIPTVTSQRVLFCSSVLNLAELLGVRTDLHPLKKVVYFHENQFVYPVQEIKSRDIQYCYNELMTCLAADVILFNSYYNMKVLLNGISKVIKLLPDYRPKNIKDLIEVKCRVLYFPMEYPRCQPNQQFNGPLHILWPHRWEFDKNPEEFFDVLYSLKKNGLKFNVSILGESFSEIPQVFEKAKENFPEEIKHYGFVEKKSDYYDIIRSCHVAVSTAKHEFFGVALLEAAYCGCMVLAPNRLVYPEIYPASCLYNSSDELYELLEKYCSDLTLFSTDMMKVLKDINFNKYSFETLLPQYLELFEVSEQQ